MTGSDGQQEHRTFCDGVWWTLTTCDDAPDDRLVWVADTSTDDSPWWRYVHEMGVLS